MKLAASIATHNRKDDLRRTLDRLKELRPGADEIWVCADGCSDGTVEMVRNEYRYVTLLENQASVGSIDSRDRILRQTRADLVLSLDDDSYPVESVFIAQAKELFEVNSRLGVAFFPQRSDEFPASLCAPFSGHARPIGSFANSGAVIRKDLYLQIGGYPTFFFHAYEEPDFALRVWAAGYQVYHYPHLSIRHHYSSSQRSEIRTHHRHSRNEVLSVLMRCPMPWMPFLVAYRMFKQCGYAWERGLDWVVREPQWWVSAVRLSLTALRNRSPVAWDRYRQWLCLLGSERYIQSSQDLADASSSGSEAAPSRQRLKLAVSIATHNRKEDLRRTLAKLAELNPGPDEIWVCADGCSDGSVDMVRSEYPWVRILENNPSLGSIGSRDRIIRSAESELILSLDDDSYPLDFDFVPRVKELFEQNLDLGIVYFPQRSDEFPETLQQTDFGQERWIGSYANSGAVFRRDLYLSLPGYPKFFFHMYEEPDFALQVWAAGKQVLYYPQLLVRHHYSSMQRNEIRIHHRHSRNEYWSVLMRCPMPWMPLIAACKAASQMKYAFRRGWGWVFREPLWWKQALGGIPAALRNRKPVKWQHYRFWLSLMKGGIPAPPAQGATRRIGESANRRVGESEAARIPEVASCRDAKDAEGPASPKGRGPGAGGRGSEIESKLRK